MSLTKALTTRGLTLIAVGGCIGSGIFVSPSQSVKALPHHGWALIAWVIGGIVSLMGAMTFSELGARYPREGGVYVYLKEAYGDLVGFLYGWIILFIVNTGAIAALSVVCVIFMHNIFTFDKAIDPYLSIAVIWLLTAINIVGVRTSQHMASSFSTIKLLAMVAIVIIGLLHISSMNHDIHLDLTTDVPSHLLSSILVAFVGVFWSMGGWHHASFMAGEAIDPQRTVPRAMVYATSIVTVAYLSIIVAYMILLPLPEMAASKGVAADALSGVYSWGQTAMSIAICISVAGSIAIYTMSAPRIYFAMAKDGIFFEQLAKLSDRYQTPYVAMIVQSIWAAVLVIAWKAFDQLATFVTFMDILFMALATASIFVLRKRGSDYTGYRVSPFPLVPLIYLLGTAAFVVNTLIAIPTESWAGVIILLVGIPFYMYFKKQKTT
jgi:basic amino acid/polyamine antiporter, APA family